MWRSVLDRLSAAAAVVALSLSNTDRHNARSAGDAALSA
ncbi:hypothetical protein GUH69_10855 [Xanthomonas citri pv. citri]|nr:hypothetical protein [Xanthomonas citri pv. citri]